MVDTSSEIEKQTSEVLNPKKLDLNVWPPRASSAVLDAKPKVTSEEILPKKKINDLIAKFNSGSLENDSPKKEFEYKNEYGATKSVGKIHTDVFH
ncbi:unnamed protein product [Auanema sp. JU1783]|nr:unnamed protein product [Auanema sp. JU1783]